MKLRMYECYGPTFHGLLGSCITHSGLADLNQCDLNHWF